ncbi:MAG TPA: bifunctional nuclease family protein [Candidatus Binatia bacterium]|nr:bifunctional nuclease family protein [Candidatus Binatia bacterium]
MTHTRRASIVALLVVALAVVVSAAVSRGAARDRGEPPAARPTGPQEAEVIAAYLERQTQTPVILLRGKRDRRLVHLAIGPTELNAIAIPLNGVTPPRPLTHDLFLTLFGRLKVQLTRVVITDLRDDIYYAVVHLQTEAGEIQLDSRPSDAIALAVRARVPVLVEDRVFEKAGALDSPRRPAI